ncbi:hypothetical protein PR202_ga15610 [Eleusine coracana subsp. coracana]|uniref:Alpha/beta hydrolase fold-3 domain-containing protein n=1 Tax=Eleusine coracana subsp. coracana TaxID=191504 RepID=A0AAV5CKB3_ELECO|nr:hypothetical protein PR202_ga15610 [Eleusine coracana subsp. coracana]
MDPATKLRFDSPLLRIYDDGRVERFFGTETTAPGFDADTGVTSKDVVIDSATGVFVRLYIPADLPATEQKKLPILVHFHGGCLVLDSATSPMYHRYLNSTPSSQRLPFSAPCRLTTASPRNTRFQQAMRIPGQLSSGPRLVPIHGCPSTATPAASSSPVTVEAASLFTT